VLALALARDVLAEAAAVQGATVTH
jgi:hypothetical protein